MTDTATTNELTSTLEWLRTTAESSSDFIIEQAPLYAQELLAYGLWSNVFMLTVSLVAILIGFALVRWCLITEFKDSSTTESVCVLVIFFNSASLLFGGISSLYTISNILQIHLAPRVYILEHLPNILQ